MDEAIDHKAVELYKTKMNVLNGQRIGDETRRKSLDKLIDCYISGYLTEEEYDHRQLIVEAAKTQQDINIVFSDLYNAGIDINVKRNMEVIRTGMNQTSSRMTIAALFCRLTLITVFGAMVSDSAVHHNWTGVIVLSGITCLYLTRLFRKDKENQ